MIHAYTLTTGDTTTTTDTSSATDKNKTPKLNLPKHCVRLLNDNPNNISCNWETCDKFREKCTGEKDEPVGNQVCNRKCINGEIGDEGCDGKDEKISRVCLTCDYVPPEPTDPAPTDPTPAPVVVSHFAAFEKLIPEK